MLAAAILTVHVAVIGFNLFGLIAVPLGAWRGWNWVHRPAWRLLHLLSLAVVAAQAAMGRACFLTIWQSQAESGRTNPEPLIVHWVNALVYWRVPLWVFAAIYCTVFAYALALVWRVPLRRG